MSVQWEKLKFPVQRRVLKMMIKFLTNEKRKSSVQSVIERTLGFQRGDSANDSSWGAQRKEQDPHRDRWKDTLFMHRTNPYGAMVRISVEQRVVSKAGWAVSEGNDNILGK